MLDGICLSLSSLLTYWRSLGPSMVKKKKKMLFKSLLQSSLDCSSPAQSPLMDSPFTQRKKKSVIFMAFGSLSQPHFLPLPPHSLAAAPWPSDWPSAHHTRLHLRAFAFAVPCLQFSHSRPLHGSRAHCTVDMYIDTATCTFHKFLLHITSGRSLSWLPCSACSLQSPFSVF